MGPIQLNRLVNISLRNRYVWYKIPKAGCTSVATALIRLELASLPGTNAPPHQPAVESPFVKPYQLTPRLLDTVLTGEGFTRFAVVRNPYTRILSAYLDKVGGNAPERRLVENALDRPEGAEISFADFLAATRKVGNQHWLPQSRLVGPRIDAIIHLETLGDDLSLLPDPLAGHLRATLTHSGRHFTGADGRIDEFYTPDIAAEVRRVFAEDFRLFGYDDGVPSPGARPSADTPQLPGSG